MTLAGVDLVLDLLSPDVLLALSFCGKGLMGVDVALGPDVVLVDVDVELEEGFFFVYLLPTGLVGLGIPYVFVPGNFLGGGEASPANLCSLAFFNNSFPQ